MKFHAAFIAVACAAGALHAQDNPLSAGNKFLYTMIKGNLVKAAQKMPEENYSFKPTPDVRSFGQIVGHVADAQYLFCSAVKGEKKSPDNEKTKTSKADLVAALQEAFTYCDAVYNAMTDAVAPDKIKFFGNDATKLGVLSFNVAHDNEHYGNIVTYMRLKGLVPPSSESNSQ
jgi:uncharacterized damage-inducible protein DinB